MKWGEIYPAVLGRSAGVFFGAGTENVFSWRPTVGRGRVYYHLNCLIRDMPFYYPEAQA